MNKQYLFEIFADKATREVFQEVAHQRRVSFEDLQKTMEIPESDLRNHLDSLVNVNLLEHMPCILPEWSTYFVTAKGLAAERTLQRYLNDTL